MKTKDVNISIVFKLKFDKKERREKKKEIALHLLWVMN